MKTTADCWKALLDGKRLSWMPDYGRTYIHLKDGSQVDNYGQKRSFSFEYPERWQIYEEVKWYDNIPEGGVLCWSDSNIYIVSEYRKFEASHRFKSTNHVHINPTPLTKTEIQKFMDNAPD